GVAVGFLMGAVDTERVPNPGLIATKQAITRALILRPGTAGFMWRTLADAPKDRILHGVKASQLEFHDNRWPAAFHIDLLPEARGKGIGRKLVEGWLEVLGKKAVK